VKLLALGSGLSQKLKKQQQMINGSEVEVMACWVG
jgi:hypothetical protein